MSTADDIKTRFNWRKVTVPRLWIPKKVGSELVGYYGGRMLRTGQYGQYDVVIVHVPFDGAYTVSGAHITQLIDASMPNIGQPIRILWQGYKTTSVGHRMKMFEMMIAEGEALSDEALPQVNH